MVISTQLGIADKITVHRNSIPPVNPQTAKNRNVDERCDNIFVAYECIDII
jgi:hypothetical protein